MMVDWFTDAQNNLDDDGEDPMRQLFKNAIEDSRVMNDAFQARYGIEIMNRAIAELTDLMNAPDKTRGSILATLNEALNPFKNEAVRQRTSSSSFSFNELRGAPKPAARAREEAKRKAAQERGDTYNPRYARDEWDPITIYISINAEDAKAFCNNLPVFLSILPTHTWLQMALMPSMIEATNSAPTISSFFSTKHRLSLSSTRSSMVRQWVARSEFPMLLSGRTSPRSRLDIQRLKWKR